MDVIMGRLVIPRDNARLLADVAEREARKELSDDAKYAITYQGVSVIMATSRRSLAKWRRFITRPGKRRWMIHWKAIFKADRFLSTQGVFAAREKPYLSAPRSDLLTCVLRH